MSNQAIRDILIVARELLAGKYEYRYDSEHRSRPRSPGWEKTDKGWRRGLKKQQREVKSQPQKPSSVYAKHYLTRRDIDKVLLKKFDKQHAKEIASAVSDYVRDDYAFINNTLRKGKPSSQADFIAEFLKVAPKYPASETLYRGFFWDRKEMSKVTSAVSKRKPAFISDKGFSSTSVDKEEARGFSTHEDTTKAHVVLQIHGSKDGVAIGLQGWQAEKEVLLPPGAKFRIKAWHLEDEKGNRIKQCEKGLEADCFTVLEADSIGDKRVAAVEQKISLGQSPSLQSSGVSRGFIQRMTNFVPEVEIIDEPHLRVACDLTAASDGLKEYLRFTFDDVDPKAADFVNSICSEIDDLADRIRRNEGLELKVERDSQDDGTKVRVLMSDHEAMKAIREEMIEKLGKLGKKKKLKVTVGSARKILGIARELMAIDFPSQDAFDEYMKEHPEGDKANHRVVETKPEVRQKQPVEIKPEVKQSVPVVSKPEKTEKEEIEERKKLRIKGKKTKEFKSWFGDWESNPEKASKIVDNEGQPLPLLHGSDEADIKEFDASKAKSSLGIFFTADRDVAKKYGKHVYRAYLNIRKPADFREESVLKKVYKHSSLKSEGYSYDQIQQMHDEGTFWMEEGNDRVQRTVIASAKSLGYDGIIMTDSYGGQTSATDTSWIVFDGNQIMLGGQVEKLGKTGTATAPKPKVKKKLGPFDEWAIYRTKDYDGNPVKPHLDLSVQQMISGLSEKSASALLKSAVATKKETGKLKGDEDEKVKEMVKKFVDNMNPNDFSSREEYEAAKKRLIEEKPWVIYDILDQGLHP